jgi:NitT/TauT family transport system substrate-binding protein
MNRRSALRGSLALTASAGALLARARNAGAQTAKLRVSSAPVDAGAASIYAYEAGIYTKYGLDVELVMGGNGSTIAAAVAGGSLDVGSANTLAIATAHEHGVAFVFIAPSGDWTSKAPTGGLLVAPASPVRSAHDLNGKTVGVAIIHGLAEITVRTWIDKNGGNSETVKFLELPYSESGAALAAGRADAASVEEPNFSLLVSSGYRLIARPSDAIASQWTQGGYFCTLDFARAHPDIVKKFAAAMAETAVWANKNHDATAQILEKYSHTPVNPATHRMFYPEHLSAAEMQPLIDAAARYGVLKAPFPAQELFAPGL